MGLFLSLITPAYAYELFAFDQPGYLTPEEDTYIPTDPVTLFGGVNKQQANIQGSEDLTLTLDEIGVIGFRVNNLNGELTHVYPGTPAKDAGLREFDRLIAVNGVAFKKLTEIKINGHKAHKELVGRVDRIPICLDIEAFTGCPRIKRIWVERMSVLELPSKVQQHYKRLVND